MIREGLVAPMDVRAIGNDGVGGFGIDGLKKSLGAYAALSGFPNIEEIAIIYDNDENPAAALVKVRGAILGANSNPSLKRKYSLPNDTWVHEKNGAIGVSLLALPDGPTNGCLDTLVVQVLERMYAPAYACAEAALTCAGIGGWSLQKRHKALARATLALVNQDNPAAPLTAIWEHKPGLVPPSSPEFGPLVAALNAM